MTVKAILHIHLVLNANLQELPTLLSSLVFSLHPVLLQSLKNVDVAVPEAEFPKKDRFVPFIHSAEWIHQLEMCYHHAGAHSAGIHLVLTSTFKFLISPPSRTVALLVEPSLQIPP